MGWGTESVGRALFAIVCGAVSAGAGGLGCGGRSQATASGPHPDAAAEAAVAQVTTGDAGQDVTASSEPQPEAGAGQAEAQGEAQSAPDADAQTQAEADAVAEAEAEAGCAIPGCLSVVDLQLGLDFSCALLSDTNVYCWGSDGSGQLGTGADAGGPRPTRISGLTGVKAIALGGSHACALRDDATVWCWGSFGDDPQGLDSGPADTPAAVPIGGVAGAKDIAAGTSMACAVLSDSTVRCWGCPNSSLLGDEPPSCSRVGVAVTGLSDAVAVAVGRTLACALRAGGRVSCWGRNEYAQLGDGTTTDSDTPVDVLGLTGAVSVATGDQHACARMSDGSLQCWGDNFLGQLGLGEKAMAPADGCGPGCWGHPTPVSISGLVDVTAGNGTTCAVDLHGKLFCWGWNDLGQLGTGSSTGPTICGYGSACSTSPNPVSGLTGVVKVRAGDAHVCAVGADNTVWCWGEDVGGGLGYPLPVPAALCAGDACSTVPQAVQWQ